MSTPATAPAEETRPLSEVERLVDTFIAPTKTFTDIRRNASWWVPWLLMAVVGLAMVYVVDKKVGFDRVVQNQIDASPKATARMDQLSPEQRAQQMETSAKVTGYIAYGYSLLTIVIATIMAGVLMATFNFGLGQSLRFPQCMAITMYAFLPGLIRALLSILSIFIGGGESFTFQEPLASNLGFLFDPNSSHFLHSIAAAIDFFNIWMLVLTGIGYSCVTRVKRSTCMAVVFGWWAVVTLAGAAMGSLFG